MTIIQRALSNSFNSFFASKKAGGIVLVLCTILSLVLANSAVGPQYLHAWHVQVGGLSIEQWVNDALMTIFFLLIGL